MMPRPATPDALRPDAAGVLDAWATRVRAERGQTDRARELADPADFYAPTAHRFRPDPSGVDAVGQVLLALAHPADVWLDVGAGGGRYALPIAEVTGGVIAVDPSPSMLAILAEGMERAGIGNIRAIESRWPPATGPDLETFRADVALMAHVGYDIDAIGPFLDAFEAAAGRLCVAVMGEGAMTTVGRLYWGPIHGEQRVPLPALPELLALLVARDRLPAVTLVDRPPPTYDDFEALRDRARRQLWLRPGSAKDVELERLLRRDAREVDGRWSLPEDRTRIGVATWEPPHGGVTPSR